jgi:hypothetical protein
VPAEEGGEEDPAERHLRGAAERTRVVQDLGAVVPDRDVAGDPVHPLLDQVPAAVSLPLPAAAEIGAVAVGCHRGVHVHLRTRLELRALVHAPGDVMVTPHVPGAEPGRAVMPAAFRTDRAAVEAGQLAAAAEVEPRRELDVVAQVQDGRGGQARLPHAGEGGVELAAADARAILAGVGGRALAVEHRQRLAATGNRRIADRAELGQAETAGLQISPGALPGGSAVAGELALPGGSDGGGHRPGGAGSTRGTGRTGSTGSTDGDAGRRCAGRGIRLRGGRSCW